MNYKYAVTIKNNQKDRLVYKEDHQEVTDDIFPSDNVTIIKSVWELDSRARLHQHLYIITKYKLNYKSLMRKGWHIYIRQITDKLDGWLTYIMKDPRPYLKILQERFKGIDENLFLEFD